MKSVALAFAAAVFLLAGPGSGAAQDNSIVGTWPATDPATGNQEQLIITDSHLQFGPNEPPLPYTATQTGNLFVVTIGDGSVPPLRMNLLGDGAATLTPPGGEPIALTRVATAAPAAPPAAAAAAAPAAPTNAFDETLSAFVPFGVTTRFEPLNRSLEQLLAEGWRLNQAAGASGNFTLLISKGDTHAICMLIPHSMGQAATALSDCRRLN